MHPFFRSCSLLFMMLTVLFLLPFRASGQTIPVGDLMEEQLRIQQLLNDSLSTSFSNRSTWMQTYNAYMDEAAGRVGWWNRKLQSDQNGSDSFFRWGIYNPVFQTTYNSMLPHGENNGAAWYGRGFTSEILGGGYITSDYVTISIRPHLVYQQNRDFEVPRFILENEDGNIRYVAEGDESISERIDAPFRFGPDPFWTSNLGHSSLRVHYKKMEAGVSTEPLWWGPAVKYPLLMSNNAPGFPHTFLGTREALKLPFGIGALEFNWVLGWPQDSDYWDLEEHQEQRFLNTININFSPGFFPGLYLGATRLYQMYIAGRPTWDDITIMFEPLQNVRLIDTSERNVSTATPGSNQIATLYARWVIPSGHAEIYGEYMREDHSFDWRDFLMQPRHNSGYMFGFQKLFFTQGPIDFIRVNAEYTTLTAPRVTEVRDQSYYYTHGTIRQGHTNRGQVLGAAVGPGSNSQFMSADAYFSDYRVGLFLQRHAINDHLHYRLNRELQGGDNQFNYGNGDHWNHRININIGANALWQTGPFIFEGRFTVTNAMNYGRFDLGETRNFRNFDPYDVVNFQVQLGGRYVF